MANELKYGDAVSLENGYSNWAGGFLDVTAGAQPGAVYAVQTASTDKREGLSGTWKIASASGKADGTTAVSGDLVYLVNQYGPTSYLDVNGGPAAGATGEKLAQRTLSRARENEPHQPDGGGRTSRTPLQEGG